MQTPAARSARVTLRQLCGLGLPASMLLPSLLGALREVVPASHAAFFYCDACGNIVNMYAERMLPPEQMARYHERHFRSEVGAFARDYLARVAGDDPVSASTLSDADRQTDYYRDVLAPLGVRHILYGIVRDRARVVGQLSLYRDAAAAGFSPADQDALRGVLHYLGEALAVPSLATAAAAATKVAEEAVAAFDGGGSLRLADGNWMRLLRMARGDAIAPRKAGVEGRALVRFTSEALLAARQAPDGMHTVESPWGRFAFRHFAMEGADPSIASVLRVSRLAADPVTLAEGAAQLALTPQQRQVALMLTQGATNADIALRLGVTINTANYHVKRLFDRLGVHERQQVAHVLRMTSGSPQTQSPLRGSGAGRLPRVTRARRREP